MKKFSYVLAALATIAIAAPAVAQDKPMMGDGMKKPMMGDGMKKPMMRHHHHMMQKHAMHKHAMHKRMTMKKDSM